MLANDRPSRRGLLVLVSAGAVQPWSRLWAGNSDFWNKKDPAHWSGDDVQRLASRSPWAKEISATTPQYVDPGSRDMGPSNGNMGNLGTPTSPGAIGMPGGRMGGASQDTGGGRRGGGGLPMQFTGVVRWESAKPIQEALKTRLPEAFTGDYVISLTGIPILGNGRLHTDDGDVDTAVSQGPTPDLLERVQNLTYLQPKGKDSAQPGGVQRGTGVGGAAMLLFGFSRELMPLTLDDKEVSFTTQLGRLEVRTKFSLKDMMYHGELAL